MLYLYRLVLSIIWIMWAICVIIFNIIGNIIIFLWYLNFKHFIYLTGESFHFILSDSIEFELHENDDTCTYSTYQSYYKSPIDVLKGHKTREEI